MYLSTTLLRSLIIMKLLGPLNYAQKSSQLPNPRMGCKSIIYQINVEPLMPRVKPGDDAPDFTVDSVNMGRVTLSDYRGYKTLLIFSRYFGCPNCQLEFDELREFLKSHTSLEVLYVNQSLPETARKFIEGKDIDFPVIAQPKVNGKYELYELYGISNLNPLSLIEIFFKGRRARRLGKRHGPYEGVETQSPAQFLIDEDVRIVLAEYGLFNPEKLKSALSL
jgi:peroxiredoxin Q/BCP